MRLVTINKAGPLQFSEDTLFELLTDCTDFDQRNSNGQSLIHIIPAVHTCVQSATAKPNTFVYDF